MSYVLHPYAVSVEEIRQLRGSGQARLVKKLVKRSRAEFAEIDELDEDVVPMERAITDFMSGAPLDDDAGFKYGYVIKALCELRGRMLSNRHWSGIGWEDLEQVDDDLEQLGIAESILRADPQLTTRGAPLELPPIDDFPAIGFLVRSEIAAASPALGAVPPDILAACTSHEAIVELRGWLEHCVRKQCDLICVYH